MLETIATQFDHFRNSRLQPENLYFILSFNKRVLNRHLHTPGGRAEFPSVRLYSNLKKLCEKGSFTYLATGGYAVPLALLLTWNCLVSTASAITLAFASSSMPLQTSPCIASSPYSLPKGYHQKHGISRDQDRGSKTFAALTDHSRLPACSLLPILYSYTISLPPLSSLRK